MWVGSVCFGVSLWWGRSECRGNVGCVFVRVDADAGWAVERFGVAGSGAGSGAVADVVADTDAVADAVA